MSTGFRLFLLTVLVFAVIWVTKYRAEDIAYWFRAPRSVQSTLGAAPPPLEDFQKPVVIVKMKPPEVRPRPPDAPQMPGPQGSRARLWAADPATLEEALEYGAEGPPIDPTGRSDPASVPSVSGSDDDSRFDEDRDGAAIVDTETLAEPPSPDETKDQPSPETASYVVESGDTLGEISLKVLGTSHRWREIAQLNPGVNPQALRVGSTLEIPPR